MVCYKTCLTNFEGDKGDVDFYKRESRKKLGLEYVHENTNIDMTFALEKEFDFFVKRR